MILKKLSITMVTLTQQKTITVSEIFECKKQNQFLNVINALKVSDDTIKDITLSSISYDIPINSIMSVKITEGHLNDIPVLPDVCDLLKYAQYDIQEELDKPDTQVFTAISLKQ